jgi:hypothetical protein
MKNVILLFFVIMLATLAKSQVHYKSNENHTEMYYENILSFDGKPINELHELTKKFFMVNGYNIRYEDENEIYATGNFETKYRGWFLFFFNTKEFNCLFDLKISLKDNKIKYDATNFVLIYKYYTISSSSWYSNPTTIGNLGWSTTQIPTEVPKKAVNIHFKAGKTGKHHVLFQDLDCKMTIFEQGLIDMIQAKEDEW